MGMGMGMGLGGGGGIVLIGLQVRRVLFVVVDWLGNVGRKCDIMGRFSYPQLLTRLLPFASLRMLVHGDTWWETWCLIFLTYLHYWLCCMLVA